MATDGNTPYVDKAMCSRQPPPATIPGPIARRCTWDRVFDALVADYHLLQTSQKHTTEPAARCERPRPVPRQPLPLRAGPAWRVFSVRSPTAPRTSRTIACAAWGCLAVLSGCQSGRKSPSLGSPRETMSDRDLAAAAAATAAMDMLPTDPEPDTEIHSLVFAHPAGYCRRFGAR